MNEVMHFTYDANMSGISEMKSSPNDNAYGVTKAAIVRQYLTRAYSAEDAQAEIESFGKKYKVLRRNEVTVFYDADGNTLFDVENTRLQSEYEWLNNNVITPDADGTQDKEPIKCFTGKSDSGLCGAAAYCNADHKCCAECTDPCNSRCGWLDKEEKQEDDPKLIPMGTASLADIVTENVPAPTPEEIAVAEETMEKQNQETEEVDENAAEEVDTGTEEKENVAEIGETPGEGQKTESSKKEPLYIGIDGAVKKLQDELKKASAKDKQFAEPCIEFLINRCNESESFAEDVCQDHKTWEKCYKYIFEQAKKKLNNISGPVRSDTVFEWAEDYFHLDDKAIEEQKAKEEADRKKKAAEQKKKEKEKKAAAPATKKEEEPKPAPAPVPKTEPKPQNKQRKNEMEGQIDLFSLMGNM